MELPVTPPALQPGDTLAIVAPASSPSSSALAAGIECLEAAGYQVKQYRPLCEPVGYLSGSDEARATELMQAFLDPEVSGILAVRGGYGVGRLLDRLDYEAIRQQPKLLAGYSDITALHLAIDQRAGLVTYHAPHVVDCLWGGGPLDDESVSSWQRMLKNCSGPYDLIASGSCARLNTITSGIARGRLLGGNLAVLCGLVGTPFEPDTTRRVLFLEDVGEPPYRVDRMLRQLQLAGKLDAVAAVVLGHFTDCDPTPDSPSRSINEVLDEYFGRLGVPVLAGFPAGHAQPNLPLPHGALVELDADRQRFTVHR